MSGHRTVLVVFAIFIIPALVSARVDSVTSVIMSRDEVQELFTESLAKTIGINYPVRRVYRSTDRTGVSHLVLAESIDSVDDRQDTIHRTIQAVMCRFDSARTRIVWSMRDHVRKRANYDTNARVYYEEETSIYFWTRYCKLDDVDYDGKVDPIIVHGRTGTSGIDDARVVITIFHRGRRYSIRHQNGDLDYERYTRVDKGFYTLPRSHRDAVMAVMRRMEVDHTCIFPVDWEPAMQRRKSAINQRSYRWLTD
jgi:hypothetical protein